MSPKTQHHVISWKHMLVDKDNLTHKSLAPRPEVECFCFDFDLLELVTSLSLFISTPLCDSLVSRKLILALPCLIVEGQPRRQYVLLALPVACQDGTIFSTALGLSFLA